MIIFGTTTYGKVDRIPGFCHVETQFVHLYFFPLVPIGTYAMLEGREDQGLRLPMSAKSVFMAWLRASAFVGMAICLIGIAFTRGGPSRASMELYAWLLTAVAVLIATWLLQPRASYARARDIVESLELGEEAQLYVDQLFDKLMPGEYEERMEVLARERAEREAAYEAQMRERFKAQREVPLNGPPQERIIATGAAHFDNQAMRQCPECGKEIRAVARLCRFCKVRF